MPIQFSAAPLQLTFLALLLAASYVYFWWCYRKTLTDMILGRRPFTDYDQMVKDWQNTAGNMIRDEFTKALAAAS